MIKKLLAGSLATLMVFSMVACGKPGGNTSGTVSVGEANDLRNDVSIAEGDKGMDEGLDFGGKEFDLALPYAGGADFQRKVDAFNEKFNAKVNVLQVDWDNFNMALTTAQNGGMPYDIIFYHAQFYPSTAAAKLLEPLESYFTTADFYNPSKPDAGGLNTAVVNSFAWNNSVYATGSIRSVFPIVQYYNKKLFKDAGLDDPMELYKKGEWTWDKIHEMSDEVMDVTNDTYFIGGYQLSWWMGINNVSGIIFENSKPRSNFKDAKLINAINSYKDMYWGDKRIFSRGEEGFDYDRFKSGKLYMHANYTDAYRVVSSDAKNSNAFAKNVANLGVVPQPLMGDSKGYPIHASQGWAAGNGSADPKVAVAFAKFESTWTDTAQVADAFPAETRQLLDKLMNEEMFTGVTGFQDSDGKTYMHYINMELNKKIYDGGDVAALLAEYEPAVQKCIVDSMNTQ